MTITEPDPYMTPGVTPNFTLDTVTGDQHYSALQRLNNRSSFMRLMLFALPVGLLAVTNLAEAIGVWLAAYHAGMDPGSVKSDFAAAFIAFGLIAAIFAFLVWRAGTSWAVWREHAPVVLTGVRRVDAQIRYAIDADCVTATEPHQTESWHLAHTSKPRRLGRFVVWNRPGYRLFFLPLPSPQAAKQLLTQLKHTQPTSRGFAMDDLPAAVTAETISVRSAFFALTAASKNCGTAGPNRFGTIVTYLSFIAKVACTGFIFSDLVTTDMSSNASLMSRLVQISLIVALLYSTYGFASFLPRPGHFLSYRRGLMKGFDWGEAAATCDKSGIRIWQEGRRIHLRWSAIRAVHACDALSVIEAEDNQLFAVPQLQGTERLLLAYRASQGQDPWSAKENTSRPAANTGKSFRSHFANMIFWIICFLVVFGLFSMLEAQPASAQLQRDETLPAWYQEVDDEDRLFALSAAAPIDLPVFDEKVRVSEDGYQVVWQSFFVVRERSNLETFGQVQLFIDPNYEQATLHRLRLHRDGEILDQLSLPFTLLSSEPELSSGVMQGNISFFAQIRDLRVGDTIELIWSKTATTPVFPNHFHYSEAKPGGNDWERQKTTIDLPADINFSMNSTDAFDITRRMVNDRIILEWSTQEPPEDDRNVRSAEHWDVSNDGFQLSTFRDWSQVADGLAADYVARPDLLPDDLVAQLEVIAQGSDDTEWKATQALRLVQDRVRYFSVAIGDGGWIPRKPDEVWPSGFGDCKDKALLLISMLAKLDITADVVIVDYDIGPALPRMLPSPFIFDHAIVRIRDPQGDWFVDPTDLLQGGIGRDIPVSDFTWGLPLAQETTGLVEITRQIPDAPTSEVVQTYTFLDEGPIAATLDVTQTWRGVDADTMRWRYDRYDLEERRESFEGWYAKRFPGATHPEPLIIQDDLDANAFTVVQHYKLPHDGFEKKALWDRLNHYGFAVAGKLYEFDDDEELVGFSQVNDPMHIRHKVVMRNVPAPLPEPEPLSFENDFIDFDTSGGWDETTAAWHYEWRLVTKKTTLEPGDELAWAEGEDFVDGHDHYAVDLHDALFHIIENRPIYMGLNAAQLMTLPAFLIVSLIGSLLFRRGVRAEVTAARAMVDQMTNAPNS